MGAGPRALALLEIGAVDYGVSLHWYLLAPRYSPPHFIGALVTYPLGKRAFSGWLIAAAALVAAGVLLHMGEQHRHRHVHEELPCSTSYAG